MSILNEQFFTLFHEITGALRTQLNQRLKPLGLTQAKWRTLLCLSLAEKPLKQTEIAMRTGIEGATLVGLLDRLAASGWVVRENTSNDRRSKIVNLSPKAQKKLASIRQIINELRDETLSIFSQQELKMCIKLLLRIKSHLKNNHDKKILTKI